MFLKMFLEAHKHGRNWVKFDIIRPQNGTFRDDYIILYLNKDNTLTIEQRFGGGDKKTISAKEAGTKWMLSSGS